MTEKLLTGTLSINTNKQTILISGAAKVGYEVMLQDDFSHPTSYLLTLYSCVKHLYSSDQLPRWEPAYIDPEAVTVI